MSNQQTDPSIEDVLSSIRRLVTSGDRTAKSVADDGALVLTPSLRIETGDEDAPDGGHADESVTFGAREGEGDPQADFATGEAADEDWPDPDEVAALARLDGAMDQSEALSPTADGTAAADRTALEETIAELEDAVTRQVEDWEPDGTEPDTEVDWSVAETGAASFFSSRLAQRASAAPLTLNNPKTTTVPPQTGTSAAMDREALRQLVAEVLREELSGELGERITRNVRRMVRREVAQALAVRDFS